MKTIGWKFPLFAASLALALGSGCSDSSGDTVLFKGIKENLRVGIEQSIVNIPTPGAGLLTARVSWSGPQRIRAYFTLAGPGTRMGDLTSASSPFEISGATAEGSSYIFYLGNPDGPDVVDVEYTITFDPD